MWHSFNIFDWIIVAIIGLSFVISLFRGFLREAISLITWVIGLLLGLKLSVTVGDWAFSWIHQDTLRYIIAFVVIFIVLLIIGAIINAIIRSVLKKTGLGFMDNFLGGVFGAARGVLLMAIVILLINVTTFKDQTWYTESQLAPKFMPLVNWLKGLIPQQVDAVKGWATDVKQDVDTIKKRSQFP